MIIEYHYINLRCAINRKEKKIMTTFDGREKAAEQKYKWIKKRSLKLRHGEINY